VSGEAIRQSLSICTNPYMVILLIIEGNTKNIQYEEWFGQFFTEIQIGL